MNICWGVGKNYRGELSLVGDHFQLPDCQKFWLSDGKGLNHDYANLFSKMRREEKASRLRDKQTRAVDFNCAWLEARFHREVASVRFLFGSQHFSTPDSYLFPA